MAPMDVFLVDPSTLFRQGLRQLLPSEFHVCGEARDHVDACDVLQQRLAPDLILVDCPADVLEEAITRLKLAAPAAAVVYLSSTADLDRLRLVLGANAAGYLTKDRTPEVLVEQLRLIMLGEMVYPSSLARKIIPKPTYASVELQRGVSAREAQILRCLVNGHSNKQIAATLGIMDATVKIHLKLLMRKLQVSNRTQAAIWARVHGYGSLAAAA